MYLAAKLTRNNEITKYSTKKMKEKIVGIDLGTGSLGISVRNMSLGESLEEQLEWFSVTTFESGTSSDQTGEHTLAADRRSHVQSRRMKDHSRWKRWATLALLIEYDMCPMSPLSLERWRTYDKKRDLKREFPIDDEAFMRWIRFDFDGDGKSDLTAFQLRKQLVEEQFDFTNSVNRYKLGRAIYHIAQHRGFKSSKGETLSGKEEDTKDVQVNADNLEETMKKSEEKKSKDLSAYMAEHGFKTVGQAFASLEDEGIRVRNSRYQVVRSLNVEEIEEYFKFQEGLNDYEDLHKRLISTKKGEGTLFYKLPLRPQKGHIGKCTFERNKRRCPISHPEYEKYRAWGFINNIRYREGSEASWQELPIKLKHQLYEEVFVAYVRKDFPFEKIRAFLEKQLGITFKNTEGAKNINYKDKTIVAGCPVTARLQNIANLFDTDIAHLQLQGHKTRSSHSIKNEEKHTVTYSAEDLWHFCFEADEIEDVKRFAMKSLSVDDKTSDALCKLWASIETGYTSLSLKALRNINRMLEYGLKTSDAIFLAKVPEITGDYEIAPLINLYDQEVKVPSERLLRVGRIANTLISKYKSLSYRDRFADHDFSYQLQDDDKEHVLRCIQDNDSSFGLMDAEEQQQMIKEVTNMYQSFFKDIHRDYIKTPKLADTLVERLKAKYPHIDERKWKQLYHPSMISDFPRNKEDENLLGSPRIGAIRNPTVLRALNVLRRTLNKMITDGLVDPQETRLVVETTRVNNDINKRWAIEKYNNERRDANKEICNILKEYYPNKEIREEDVDAARYVLEQSGEDIFTDDKPEDLHYRHQIKRYRLWLEQGCCCLYTGKTIGISNLLEENHCDLEHTIPRSLSFDSSDKNLTVCDAYYNRHIKQNRIPTQLPNYEHDVTIDGHTYTAIKPRLKSWEEKVERLSQNVLFWKNRARRAQTEDSKNACIRQRLLWQMEYDYWRQKLDRFKMKPENVTDGFRNSQLVDTGIITRYAVLYLKTLFGSVEVQNGQSTSAFRKIFGIPLKDRSSNYHHAVDATILTMIPQPAKRDRMLKLFYQIDEEKKGNQDVSGLRYHLHREIEDCLLGAGIASIDDFIARQVMVDFYKQDRTLQKNVRPVIRKGKPLMQKDESGKMVPVTFCSDSIRGELHKQTFFGAIRRRGEEKNLFVVREPLKYKTSNRDSGFKDWKELNDRLVDLNYNDKGKDKEFKPMVQMMMSQFPEGTSFKDACEQGIYMLDRNGRKVNRIRHSRCYGKNVTNPIKVKRHAYSSEKDYKQFVWAALGEGSVYALCEYVNGSAKAYQRYTYMDISENRKQGLEDIPSFILDKKGQRLTLIRKICKGDMLLIYKDSPEELLNLDSAELSKRLYKVQSFERKNDIILRHHLLSSAETASDSEGREKKRDRGESIKDFAKLPNIIRSSITSFKYLQKDVDIVFTKDGLKLKNI